MLFAAACTKAGSGVRDAPRLNEAELHGRGFVWCGRGARALAQCGGGRDRGPGVGCGGERTYAVASLAGFYGRANCPHDR
jgi:hypothetical protein